MSHVWQCKCGLPWYDKTHKAIVLEDTHQNAWRGNPAQLIPYRQWIRENLPGSRDGITVACDDGFIRMFSPLDPIGWTTPHEFKTYGAQLDTPTDKTFACIRQGRVTDRLVVQMAGGSTPGPLKHYPIALPDVRPLTPEPENVATRVYLNGYEIDANDLPTLMLRNLRKKFDNAA